MSDTTRPFRVGGTVLEAECIASLALRIDSSTSDDGTNALKIRYYLPRVQRSLGADVVLLGIAVK